MVNLKNYNNNLFKYQYLNLKINNGYDSSNSLVIIE